MNQKENKKWEFKKDHVPWNKGMSYLKEKECPECGKEFCKSKKYCSIECRNKNRKGINNGMYKGGKQKYNCQYCGKEFENYSSQSTKFCSMKCSQKSQVGLTRLNCIEKVKVACKQCGKTEFVWPSQAKTYVCCSRKCMGLLQRGKEHPEKQKRVTLICHYCGKEYNRIKSRAESSNYCNRDCMYKDIEYRNRLSLSIKKAYEEKGTVGFTNLKHSEETKRICRIKALQRLQERGNIQPTYNPAGCNYFQAFDSIFNTQGQYATNGGEYHIKGLGYFLDYINHHLELIIEYDESGHYNYQGNLKEKDVTRQKEIQGHFPNYEFIRVNEEELKKWIQEECYSFVA